MPDSKAGVFPGSLSHNPVESGSEDSEGVLMPRCRESLL